MYPISSIRSKFVVICCAALFAAPLASTGCNGDEEGADEAEEVEQEASKAEVRATENDIRLLTEAVTARYIREDELPERLEELTQGSHPLVDQIPDDPWGNEYVYEVEGEREFEIFSKGPDGEAGTEADITVD